MPTALGDVAAALAGRYRVERELGAGGMATVYLAFLSSVRSDARFVSLMDELRPRWEAIAEWEANVT
jgi:hypothetical protein